MKSSKNTNVKFVLPFFLFVVAATLALSFVLPKLYNAPESESVEMQVEEVVIDKEEPSKEVEEVVAEAETEDKIEEVVEVEENATKEDGKIANFVNSIFGEKD